MPVQSLTFEHADSAAAILTEEPAPDFDLGETWTGPGCVKCESPMTPEGVVVCRKCGWYPSLGIFVEVDPDFECDHEDSVRETQPRPSHIQVWMEMIPWWGWVILGSTLAVVLESVFVRVVTPSGIGGIRTSWSLAQLTIGTALVFGCHVATYVVLAAEDSELGLLDILLRPIKIWLRAFQRLPARLWVSDGAAVGLTAILMSILVIGAIPYERLWDWGITPPPKQDLMGAIMDQAKRAKESGADNLEEAIGDFAGRGEGAADAMANIEASNANRRMADCVILGYRIDKEGRLTQLLLGTAHLGKLVYAGTVSPKLDDDERASLVEALRAIKAHEPYLRIEAEALWVKPELACRVSYVDTDSSGRLNDPKWDSMVGSL